jgi:hypothetical protein
MQKLEDLNFRRTASVTAASNRWRPALYVAIGLSAFNLLVMLVATLSSPKIGAVAFNLALGVDIYIVPIFMIALPIVWWLWGRATIILYAGAVIVVPFVWLMFQVNIFGNTFHVRK